jgi:hypothetical protein
VTTPAAVWRRTTAAKKMFAWGKVYKYPAEITRKGNSQKSGRLARVLDDRFCGISQLDSSKRSTPTNKKGVHQLTGENAAKK